MKTILLHIYPDTQQDARIQCALDLARVFGSHITCLQVMSFEHFVGADPLGGVYIYGELLTAVREQEQAEKERISARLRDDGASFDWVQVDGDIARTIVSRSPLADVIVLSQPGHEPVGRVQPASVVGNVATQALGPVLVLPSTTQKVDMAGTAMVAWNGSPECAHALRLSLPFLRAAAAVHVVEVADAELGDRQCEAVRYLAAYHIKTELQVEKREDRSTADALLAAAERLDVDYIVMGAYGHSRFLETVLGGVTHELIAACPLPLLLAR